MRESVSPAFRHHERNAKPHLSRSASRLSPRGRCSDRGPTHENATPHVSHDASRLSPRGQCSVSVTTIRDAKPHSLIPQYPTVRRGCRPAGDSPIEAPRTRTPSPAYPGPYLPHHGERAPPRPNLAHVPSTVYSSPCLYCSRLAAQPEALHTGHLEPAWPAAAWIISVTTLRSPPNLSGHLKIPPVVHNPPTR